MPWGYAFRGFFSLTNILLPFNHNKDIFDETFGYQTSDSFCAGKLDGGSAVCDGDNGGPLICINDDGEPVLYGVLSKVGQCTKYVRSFSIQLEYSYFQIEIFLIFRDF